MVDKQRLRAWLGTYSQEQLIGLLLSEYSLKELWVEMEGDIKNMEYVPQKV